MNTQQTEAQIKLTTYLNPRSPPDIPRQRSSKNSLITMVYHFVYITLTVLLATLVIYSIMDCKKFDKYLNLRTQLPTSQTPNLSIAISTPKSSAPATPTLTLRNFRAAISLCSPLIDYIAGPHTGNFTNKSFFSATKHVWA